MEFEEDQLKIDQHQTLENASSRTSSLPSCDDCQGSDNNCNCEVAILELRFYDPVTNALVATVDQTNNWQANYTLFSFGDTHCSPGFPSNAVGDLVYLGCSAAGNFPMNFDVDFNCDLDPCDEFDLVIQASYNTGLPCTTDLTIYKVEADLRIDCDPGAYDVPGGGPNSQCESAAQNGVYESFITIESDGGAPINNTNTIKLVRPSTDPDDPGYQCACKAYSLRIDSFSC